MTFERFSEIFKSLMQTKIEISEFIDSIPKSISSAFFDNEAITLLYKENRLLSEELFGTKLYEDIDYFLYEGMDNHWYIERNGNEYPITDIKDMLEYFQKEYEWV